MRKILINGGYGDLGLSRKAISMIAERKDGVKLHWYTKNYENNRYEKTTDYFRDTYSCLALTKDFGNFFEDTEEKYIKLGDSVYEYDFEDYREDPVAIKVVEKLGEEADTSSSSIIVKEYDDEKFKAKINEYDGNESLELIPVINLQKLESLKTGKKIKEYLDSLGILYKEV